MTDLPATTLLFVGHDPGAKNHLRPVYERSLALGVTSRWIDLSVASSLESVSGCLAGAGRGVPTVLVCGSSSNQSELSIIRESKAYFVRSVIMIDLQVGSKLLGITTAEFPDRFLVTNWHCADEVRSLGAPEGAIVVTGSTYFEQLKLRRLSTAGPDLRGRYDIGPTDPFISFFGSPSSSDTIDAVGSLATALPDTGLDRPAIMIKPHPRMSGMEQLAAACGKYGFRCVGPSDNVETLQLVLSSTFSLAMASTVALESIVLGVPAAFYQLGWDYRQLDSLYANVEGVFRIRTLQGFEEFVSAALSGRGQPLPQELENCSGAIDRTWTEITGLM